METNKTKKCPKCGNIRPQLTTTPEWQCPNCLVAYDKVEKYESRMEVISHHKKNSGVLNLLDYILIILLSVLLFFLLSPLINAISEMVLDFLRMRRINGLVWIGASMFLIIFFIFYSLVLSIIPIIIGFTTRALISHNSTHKKSMTAIESLLVYIVISGGNLLVNDMNFFNAVAQSLLICFVMYFTAQARKNKVPVVKIKPKRKYKREHNPWGDPN